jgi:transaldolase/glucose-6-phosphate isomerase
MSGSSSPASVRPPRLSLGPLAEAVDRRLGGWTDGDAPTRIWEKDPTFWPAAPAADVASRLGWMSLPTGDARLIADLTKFADEVRGDGVTDVAVLGMGGSSLAPQVYAATFGTRAGYPRLHVLDSTHPLAVPTLAGSLDLRRTLFVVSSKSGTTLEPNAFLAYFWEEVARTGVNPGHQFVAVTDPDTALDRLATARGFRWICRAPPDVGGRYSALTVFGLLPAALIGVDLPALLDRARAMAAGCGPDVAAEGHPALVLAAAVGEAALAGADKLVFVTSSSLASFPSWGEQLVAESTGKIGKGIVPVADEVDPFDPMGRRDRLIVSLTVRGESNPTLERGLASLTAAGAPMIEIELGDRLDLGAEFFRWEMAIAAAGAVVGIDPFDQPDVELAKDLARAALKAPPSPSGAAPDAAVRADDPGGLADAVSKWMSSAPPGGYAAIQAYLPPGMAMTEALQRLRGKIRRHLGSTTTLGYGPRFLHSTGQLHKGGPPTGAFLQLVDDSLPIVPVPGMDVTFGRIIRAQAAGDATALRQRGRPLLTVDLGSGGVDAVDRVGEAVHG